MPNLFELGQLVTTKDKLSRPETIKHLIISEILEVNNSSPVYVVFNSAFLGIFTEEELMPVNLIEEREI